MWRINPSLQDPGTNDVGDDFDDAGRTFSNSQRRNHRFVCSFSRPNLTSLRIGGRLHCLEDRITHSSLTLTFLNEVECVFKFQHSSAQCTLASWCCCCERHGLVLGLPRLHNVVRVCVCLGGAAGPVQCVRWAVGSTSRTCGGGAPAPVKWSRPKFRETGAFSADLVSNSLNV